MEYEHKELIHDYLNIDKQNRRIERRIERVKYEFYEQNFYGSTDFDTPLGVKNKGFRVESQVSDFIDFIEKCKLNIQKNTRRQHYFRLYTNTLDTQTYSSLRHRYANINNLDDLEELGHDELVLDEILEIEEAISHQFNFNNLPEHNKKLLLVEYNNLEPDTLEESFENMLETLGVV